MRGSLKESVRRCYSNIPLPDAKLFSALPEMTACTYTEPSTACPLFATAISKLHGQAKRTRRMRFVVTASWVQRNLRQDRHKKRKENNLKQFDHIGLTPASAG